VVQRCHDHGVHIKQAGNLFRLFFVQVFNADAF
jgi:hypothetical protein